MAKWKYHLEEGPKVIHTFNGGFLDKDRGVIKRVLVPTIRAHAVDPTAGRYVVIDGKLRRRVKDGPSMPITAAPSMGATLMSVLAQMAPYNLMQGINDGLRKARAAA